MKMKSSQVHSHFYLYLKNSLNIHKLSSIVEPKANNNVDEAGKIVPNTQYIHYQRSNKGMSYLQKC